MKLAYQNGSVTTVAGAATATVYLSNSLLRHIIVAPTTATTSYNIKLIDRLDNNLIDEVDRIGVTNEITQVPVMGNFTLSITNASNDEAIAYYVASED